MIAHLEGKILKKTEKGVILKTNGVGYFVNLTADTLAEVQENQQLALFTYTHVREDILELYGFAEYDHMVFFKNLISISGIGPKLALDILSVPAEKVKAAILNEDINFLREIHGIGPKSAKRIILELKSKIEAENLDIDYQVQDDINKDALEALMRLGYQRSHINNVLKNLPENIKEAEEIITYFLKQS